MRKLESWSEARIGDVVLIDDSKADPDNPHQVVEPLELVKDTGGDLVEFSASEWLTWGDVACNEAAYRMAVWGDEYLRLRRAALYVLEEGDAMLEDLTRRRAILAFRGMDCEDETYA